ncbi:hypothetical protein [Methyloceanibacter sp.]|uniref:hypothetical protein n=1 Tax=Methyloceanibacter sp. TaxID=1965321 RepID=UPI002085FE5A|nr:hypothetical protein [Methyloceanibacter sp.]GFO82806.1 MAG: hypothetical protein A49_24330 [Methyloceanibacter sp.]HML91072.1 hypothetical protein [Methyloceanibacter sp.]
MSTNHGIPPKQSQWGQLFDSLCLLALMLVLLFGPLAFEMAPPRTSDQSISAESWQSLGQNDVMASAWEGLGHTPATAKPLIAKRFDYKIDVWMLVITLLAMLIYYLVLVFISRIEYRDVISERFDRLPRPGNKGR